MCCIKSTYIWDTSKPQPLALLVFCIKFIYMKYQDLYVLYRSVLYVCCTCAMHVLCMCYACAVHVLCMCCVCARAVYGVLK